MISDGPLAHAHPNQPGRGRGARHPIPDKYDAGRTPGVEEHVRDTEHDPGRAPGRRRPPQQHRDAQQTYPEQSRAQIRAAVTRVSDRAGGSVTGLRGQRRGEPGTDQRWKHPGRDPRGPPEGSPSPVQRGRPRVR